MSFTKNIKNPLFWKNVFRIAIPFLLIVALFSLLFNTGGAIFSGDWQTVNEFHFTEKKWVRFWLGKVVISLLYGMYISNKNMK